MSELEESDGEEDVALAHFLLFPLSYPKLGSSSNYRHLISLVCPSHSTSDHLPTSPAMGKAARWFRSFLGKKDQAKDQRRQREDQQPLSPPASAKHWSFGKSSRDSTEAAAAAAQASVSSGNAAIGDEESKLAARRVNAVGCSTRIRACQWA